MELNRVKQEKIFFPKDAELSELAIYDFLREYKQYELPVIDFSIEELEKEFENIKKEFL